MSLRRKKDESRKSLNLTDDAFPLKENESNNTTIKDKTTIIRYKYKDYMEIDFEKMDGLVPAIISRRNHQERFDVGIHEQGSIR